MFGVLLALCLLPLYVRDSFSAVLRKVEKTLSDSRKNREGQELPAYAKHLHMRPTSHPSPESTTTDQGEEWSCAGLTHKQSPVLWLCWAALAATAGDMAWQDWTILWQWEWPAFPQKGCVLWGEDSCALHWAAGILDKAKRCVFKFLTVIAESESGSALGCAGLCFQLLVGTAATWTCLKIIVSLSLSG